MKRLSISLQMFVEERRVSWTGSSLANLHRLQKKYDKAEKLYDLFLPKMKTILSLDHHSTFLTMCELGALYVDKGENIKAESYFVEVDLQSYFISEQAKLASHRRHFR